MRHTPLLLLISIFCLILSGCATFLFQNPVPSSGTVLREIPENIAGLYEDSESKNIVSINEISDGYYSIIEFQNSGDSINTGKIEKTDIILIQKSDLKDHDFLREKLETSDKEKVAFIYFESDNNYYVFSALSDINCEVNVKEGWFKGSNLNGKALLKKFEETYYLNVFHKQYWYLISCSISDGNLKIKHSQISKKESFVENINYYKGITDINVFDGDQYYSNPTDDQFFYLHSDPNLFASHDWIKIQEHATSVTSGISPLAKKIFFGAIGFLVLYIILKIKAANSIRYTLLVSEINNFIKTLILLALVGALMAGVVHIGLWLFNNIDDGDCIFSLSLGGYCIIDTILLTIMATIGATGAYMFITYALKTILNFFSNIAKIISIPSEQLTDIIMNQSNESSNSA